jgi:bestrophin, other
MHSVANQMSRVNTVTSLLKRFLSKDESRTDSRPPSGASNNAEKGLGTSASSASIAGKSHPVPLGSMKIADQVIEEVDEQMTITSLRNKDDSRPTAQSLFSHQVPSDPVDVPGRVPPYTRYFSEHVPTDANVFPPGGVEDLLLSSSAPAGKMPTAGTTSDFDPPPHVFDTQGSTKSIDMEELDSSHPDHDFEKLRQEREASRQARQKEKLARSISAQKGIVNQIELQELLTEALEQNPRSESGNSSPTTEA